LETPDFDKLKELIQNCRKIVITTHHNPDGDAIGSSLALWHFLKNIGKEVSVIVPNDYPAFLKWLPGSQQIRNCGKNLSTDIEELLKTELIFCLDYNAIDRVENISEALGRATGIKVMIDHHPEPKINDFDICYSDRESSSTGELVFTFLEKIGMSDKISPEAATCLFVAIMTDTGSFSYSCNHAETFYIVSELIRKGVNVDTTHQQVYDTYSEDRLRLLGYCLSEKLKVLNEYHSAYISLSKEELLRFNNQIGDTEGVVNYALSIKGIRLAVLLTEKDDRIRLSFRSKGNFSVNDLARKYFNGGGHMNAAGGDSFESLAMTEHKLLEVLTLHKDQLSQAI
jgi:phosphoesterase RecJ-like protein